MSFIQCVIFVQIQLQLIFQDGEASILIQNSYRNLLELDNYFPVIGLMRVIHLLEDKRLRSIRHDGGNRRDHLLDPIFNRDLKMGSLPRLKPPVDMPTPVRVTMPAGNFIVDRHVDGKRLRIAINVIIDRKQWQAFTPQVIGCFAKPGCKRQPLLSCRRDHLHIRFKRHPFEQ